MHIIRKLLKTEYVRTAMEEQADLSAFRKRPSLKIITGVLLIITSFVMGWPAISALGALSVYYNRPVLVVIGGPLLYGLSHLVFLLGMYFLGAKYSKIFFKWATRVTMEKLAGNSC